MKSYWRRVETHQRLKLLLQPGVALVPVMLKKGTPAGVVDGWRSAMQSRLLASVLYRVAK